MHMSQVEVEVFFQVWSIVKSKLIPKVYLLIKEILIPVYWYSFKLTQFVSICMSIV